MALKLADTAKPMGVFPVAEAVDIEITKEDETKKSLQAMYDDGELGGESLPVPESSDKLLVTVENEGELEWQQVDKDEVGSKPFIGTTEEWESLTTADKAKYDGKEVIITDDEIDGDSLPFKFGIDENGNYGYYKVGADTVTPFKSDDIQHYRIVANIGPNTTVTTSFEEIGFVPKIVMCMNGDSAIMRYVDGSFAISVGSGLVILNNLTTWNVFQVTEEEIKMSIRWHGDTQSYNIIFLG